MTPELDIQDETARRDGKIPVCEHCGYDCSNSTEFSNCSECGKRLSDSIVWRKHTGRLQRAVRYRSERTIFGLPLVDIAIGARPHHGEKYGRAVGIIAIGDLAFGWLSCGVFSFGFVSIGWMSAGVLSIGLMAVGIVAALGIAAMGLGLTVGSGAIGGIVVGVGVVGFIAKGVSAVGIYAEGKVAVGMFTRPIGTSGHPKADALFNALDPILGGVGVVRAGIAILLVWIIVAAVGILAAIAIAWIQRMHKARFVRLRSGPA